ncbi:hydroxyisourate hydrolase [Hoyosella rhizosphaerae]|uniref:5-hydroxyisourate hydrolase n=1 Tax=Hoyosella rhizosphaerae TaxID=1755582 RepID=A0A916U0I3_9ACTN|nr:hydroxyisourate hydrolase [Hoyosella rhizosphaerae]MBN4927021.1 hydroxyisourate hydrolase [Hoyosella rhizosphaerae]GGC54675.1 5-hydroxyisourate hydrolase [Hoyosella rhizosphaerae]
MATISTHVLDTTQGLPATGVTVVLQAQDGAEIASVVTDGDGRVSDIAGDDLPTGVFRLVFGTGPYFSARGVQAFNPEIVVSVVLPEHKHYHVPLLVSPYSYTTYRGS